MRFLIEAHECLPTQSVPLVSLRIRVGPPEIQQNQAGAFDEEKLGAHHHGEVALNGGLIPPYPRGNAGPACSPPLAVTSMNASCRISATIAYGDVDRHERLLLSRLFQLLQESAIAHANQAGAGHEVALRGETWVLNRVAASVFSYPRFGETLAIETWSSGVRGFRGYREYRVRQGDHVVASASSLWLYVNRQSRTLARVPAEVAARFPAVEAERFEPNLDRVVFVRPADTSGYSEGVTVRYSDIDGNGHVNNAAYIDFLQSALARHGIAPHPRALRIKFDQEIPPETREVIVRLDHRNDRTAFAISAADVDAAVGETVAQ